MTTYLDQRNTRVFVVGSIANLNLPTLEEIAAGHEITSEIVASGLNVNRDSVTTDRTPWIEDRMSVEVPIGQRTNVVLVARRTRVTTFSSFLALDGTAGTNATTPDHNSLDVTGDLTLVYFGTLDPAAAFQWLGGKWGDAGLRSYVLAWNGTGDVVQFLMSTTGTTSLFVTRPLSMTPGPVGLLADRRQSDGRVRLFVADDPSDPDSTTWTQLGADGSLSTSNIFNSTSPAHVGPPTTGASGFGLDENVSRFIIHGGLLLDDAGTTRASPNFTAQPAGTTQFTDAQDRVWTLNGNAEIDGGASTNSEGGSLWGQAQFRQFSHLVIRRGKPHTAPLEPGDHLEVLKGQWGPKNPLPPAADQIAQFSVGFWVHKDEFGTVES